MTESAAPDAISQQLCFEAVKHTDDAVYITDAEGTIEYVNPAFEEITGYEKDEMIGQTPAILSSGEHDDAFYDELWETITDGERWETEIVDETKCGDTVVLEQTISPIATPDGEVEQFVAVARDITDRKQHERDLEQFKQIQSRILRHNLRNRLHVITSYAEYCEKHLDGEYADKAARVLSAAADLETLANKTRTIERLLDQEPTPTKLHLDVTLGNVVEAYREQHPDVSFRFHCPPECDIEAIPEMPLVFLNLVDNAVAHNDSKDPTVDIHVSTDEAVTAVTIGDNGPGIPEPELVALEQTEETDLNHGTGVGLWIVSWIVQRSRASLSFETDSTGTEFVVRFRQSESP